MSTPLQQILQTNVSRAKHSPSHHYDSSTALERHVIRRAAGVSGTTTVSLFSKGTGEKSKSGDFTRGKKDDQSQLLYWKRLFPRMAMG